MFKLSANGFVYLKIILKMIGLFMKTRVRLKVLRLNYLLREILIEVFKQYQDEGLPFVKTDVVVELSQLYGESLISRSQAQRVARNLDKFSHITLDFSKVKLIGQGFVDQLFRVYKNQNPKIIIDYINVNDDVDFMINRGIATAERANKNS